MIYDTIYLSNAKSKVNDLLILDHMPRCIKCKDRRPLKGGKRKKNYRGTLTFTCKACVDNNIQVGKITAQTLDSFSD